MSLVAKVLANEKPVEIDNSVPNTTYVGYPTPQALDATPGWAIKKIVVNAGITSITWAGGSREKKHKWSERAGLVYSRE